MRRGSAYVQGAAYCSMLESARCAMPEGKEDTCVMRGSMPGLILEIWLGEGPLT